MANMSNIISPIESGGTINHFGLEVSESRYSNQRLKKKKRNFWKQNSSSQGGSAIGLSSSLNKASSRKKVKKLGRNLKEANPQKKLDFETNKKFKCTCEKSLCKKKYCECFANGEKCLPGLCECIGCTNCKDDDEIKLNEHKKTLELDRNVSNFAVTTDTNLAQGETNPPNTQENDHCNCLHSSCLKNYCECLKAGRSCGNLCRCKECKNPHGGLKTLKSNCWLIEGYVNMIRVFIEPGRLLIEEYNGCIEAERRQILRKEQEERERLEAQLGIKNEELLMGRKRKKFLSFTGDVKEALKNEKKKEKQEKKIRKKENKNLDKPKKISNKATKRNSSLNQQFIPKLNENLISKNSGFEGQETYQLPTYISSFILPSFPSILKPKYVKVSIVGAETDLDNLSPKKITKNEELTPLQTTAMATECRQPSEGFTSDPSKKTAPKKLNMEGLSKKAGLHKSERKQIKQQEC
jgi:hypothetical protein